MYGLFTFKMVKNGKNEQREIFPTWSIWVCFGFFVRVGKISQFSGDKIFEHTSIGLFCSTDLGCKIYKFINIAGCVKVNSIVSCDKFSFSK